jgi:deoxyuridine 5'-triphosphate nucleotidohydrolase
MSETLFAYKVGSSFGIQTVTFVSEHRDLLPTLSHATDTGFDCKCALQNAEIAPKSYQKIPLGFRCLFAETAFNTFGASLRGRSGLASRGILAHVGTIDHEYTGEVSAILFNFSEDAITFKMGDRIAQLVIEWSEIRGSFFDFKTNSYIPSDVYEMTRQEFESETAKRKRGENGFGSTGR